MTAAAKSLVEQLVVMGAHGTVVALLALVIVRAGRLRPGWQAAVWLVVLAKFVLPWGPALPWSLADVIAGLQAHGGPAPVAGEPALLAAAPPAVASPVWAVIAAIWLGGTCVVLGRALIAHTRIVQAARRAPPAPREARALLAGFARRPPHLVVGSPEVGPHVVGVFRPIVVVPPALLADRSLLCAALLHELAHVRRRDGLARIVQVAAGAVFFFWPIVRLASRRLDLAREAACDAWALDVSEVPRPAYARLLVRMSQLRGVAIGLAAARGLDARVASVLGPPARARLGAVHRLALVAWIAVALGGARSAAARGETICRYTPELAEALRLAYPQADLDGDGVLSRDEACEFQAELRQRVPAAAERGERGEQMSRLGDVEETLLAEPLCCNCERGAENSAPWITKRSDVCRSTAGDEGVSR